MQNVFHAINCYYSPITLTFVFLHLSDGQTLQVDTFQTTICSSSIFWKYQYYAKAVILMSTFNLATYNIYTLDECENTKLRITGV